MLVFAFAATEVRTPLVRHLIFIILPLNRSEYMPWASKIKLHLLLDNLAIF